MLPFRQTQPQPSIQELTQNLDIVNTKIDLAKAMLSFGIDESKNDIFFDRATQTLKRLVDKGVDRETAVSFSAIEAALIEASQSGMNVHEVISSAKEDLFELIKDLTKNPLLKTDENAETVIRRVEVLMKESPSVLFIDALMLAVREREDTATRNSAVEMYSDGTGVISTKQEEI